MGNLCSFFLCLVLLVSVTSAAAPVANFTATPLSGPTPLQVSFTDLSLNNPLGWAWFFGDGTSTGLWTQTNASAGWTGRFTHSSVVMPDGSIVLMGGNSGSVRNDVWRSNDHGSTWTQQTANAEWVARYLQSSVAMPDGSIVLMGGWDNGYGPNNEVWWSTDDGATWTLVNSSPGWSGRGYHSSVAMPDGSIVLMGGYDGNFKNDVWRSTDNGVTWTLVNASAGWSVRYGQNSIVLPDSSIVLMGGYVGGYGAGFKNDVWRSTDNGAMWTQMTASAEWTGRYKTSSVVMPDGSIILMGGDDGNATNNDVWRSTDNGATWQRLPNAEWSGRSGHSSVVMPDGNIVLMGGMDSSGFKNDVWHFIPGSSVQNPLHTYTEAGTYTVALQVYNNDGYNSTQKTGYITVTEPVSMPDLTLEGLALSSNNPDVGKPVKISVLVKNALDTAPVSDNFYVTFYLGNPDKNADGIIDDDANVIISQLIEGGLPAGLSTSVWTEWTPPEVGTFDVYVVVDPKSATGDLIKESNETNNAEFIQIFPAKILPVPYLNQGNTHWCWLNSIAMVEQYYGISDHGSDLARELNIDTNQGILLHLLSNWYDDLTKLSGTLNNRGLNYNGDHQIILISKDEFVTSIENSIDNNIPPILMYMRLGEDEGHSIVIVGYSNENGTEYVYIHDPSGKFYRREGSIGIEGLMYIKVEMDELWTDFYNSRWDFKHIFYISSNKPIPPPHPVIFFFNAYDVIHQVGNSDESQLFFSRGLNMANVTTNKPILYSPSFPDTIKLQSIGVSNPSRDNVPVTIGVELYDINDNARISDFSNTLGTIQVTGQSVSLIDKSNSDLPMDVRIRKSGFHELVLTAKVDDQVVDKIEKIGVTDAGISELFIILACPVDAIVESPDGLIISKTQNQIDNASYGELDLDNDGENDDLIIIPDPKPGDYKISVIPDGTANLTDTYNLSVKVEAKEIVLAQNVQIKDIPNTPYHFIHENSDPVPLPGITTPPTDPDGDGLFEDLNANGFADWDDAVVLFWNTDWIQDNEPVGAFDFNHNGFIDWDDAVVLFWEV